MPNVLEHADTDHLVEARILRQVAVVEQLQVDLVLQTLGLHPFAGQRQLLLAECDAKNLHAVFASRKTRQPAPAAADVQQVLAALEPQLAAQVVEFILLRLLQRFIAGLEVRAGIDHLPVEPELVEVVGNIVVIGNRRRVSVLVMLDPDRIASAVIIVHQRVGQFIADPDHFAD